MSAQNPRSGQQTISLATASGWDDFLTGLEFRLNDIGAAGFSLGVLNDTRIHTFNRGFSKRACAQFATVPVDAELPGPATLRSLTPQFFDNTKVALARYPKAARVIEGSDFSAAACLPLVRNGEGKALGYLAVHYEGARHFDLGDRATLLLASTETTAAIQRLQDDVHRQSAATLGSASIEALLGELAGLRQAMINRATIEQAKGMLMERFAMDAEEAWELLRRTSNQANLKLSAVAREIVDKAKTRGS